MNKYPHIRHLTSNKILVDILTEGVIKPFPYVNKKIKEIWLEEREKNEIKKFNTTELIFCTPDWFLDYGHETGHGSAMIYFKDKIFDDYKVTFTISDNKIDPQSKVYNKDEYLKIYQMIKGEYGFTFSDKLKKLLFKLKKDSHNLYKVGEIILSKYEDIIEPKY